MISLTALITGVIILILYIKKNTIVINKSDPENTQFLIDLRMMQMKKKD
jgi:hypothetical protein